MSNKDWADRKAADMFPCNCLVAHHRPLGVSPAPQNHSHTCNSNLRDGVAWALREAYQDGLTSKHTAEIEEMNP